MASEQAPFLPLEAKPLDPDDVYPKHSTRPHPWRRQWIKSLLIHCTLIALYTITSIFITSSQRCITLLPPAAIDNLHIAYTPSIFHRLNATPYAGPPSPEIDAAWDALLKPMHISVSEAELKRDNQDSVALPESGGYLGWMGVFHELHCIVSLLHPYWSKASSLTLTLASNRECCGNGTIETTTIKTSVPKKKRIWGRILVSSRCPFISFLPRTDLNTLATLEADAYTDHCFEMLRQSAVCHADASLTTFKWHPAKSRPMFNASESIHTCVDWGLLMESVRGRVVDEEEILRLRNPLMLSS